MKCVYLVSPIILYDIYVIIVISFFQSLNVNIKTECGSTSLADMMKCETYNSISKNFSVGSEVYESCNDYNISMTPPICIKTAEEVCKKRNINFCEFNKDGKVFFSGGTFCKHEFSCDYKSYLKFTLFFIFGLLSNLAFIVGFYFWFVPLTIEENNEEIKNDLIVCNYIFTFKNICVIGCIGVLAFIVSGGLTQLYIYFLVFICVGMFVTCVCFLIMEICIITEIYNEKKKKE
jgi:hypothetical protein